MDYPNDPNTGLVNGQFSEGDPAQGIPASLDPASWANAVTDELLNVITEAGAEPAETNHHQLRDAVLQIIANNAMPKVKNNALGGVPTANDDSTMGYGIGSLYFHEGGSSASILYICRDASPGAAVWLQFSDGINGLASYSPPDADSDSSNGYTYGSIVVANATAYVCVDPTEAAAHWKPITG